MMWFVRVVSDSIKILPSPSRRSRTIKELFKAWKDNVTALADELDEPMVDQGTEIVRVCGAVSTVKLKFITSKVKCLYYNDL